MEQIADGSQGALEKVIDPAVPASQNVFEVSDANNSIDAGVLSEESKMKALVSPAAAEPKDTMLENQFLDISGAAEDLPLELPSFDVEGYLQKQRARVYQIQSLKEKVESRSIPSYAQELESETAVDQSTVTLAHVSVEMLERQQRQIEQEQAEALREERRKQAIRHKLIREKEDEAKDAVHREAEKAAEVPIREIQTG